MKRLPSDIALPGEQWRPSNATVGHAFQDRECRHCARDKVWREGVSFSECEDNELCPILAASYRGEAHEWRRLADGTIKCLVFVPADQPVPATPCPYTVDMFD